jgi:hypothetical protein
MDSRMKSAPIASLALSSFFLPPKPARAESFSLADRLGAIPKESGFKMEGYFVWYGSVIKVGSEYHMFASRWPAATRFPDGYRENSEIVRAVSPRAEGPYAFQEVVIGKREVGKWDSGMAHNPSVYKTGSTFVLFYIGSERGSRHRQIGIATANAIGGPWSRREQPLDLGIATDANNPAALFEPDGIVKLFWRTVDLRVVVSTARSFESPYTVANSNVWPSAKLEDFFFFKLGSEYNVVCEDNVGNVTGHVRWGAQLVSPDGLSQWKARSAPVAYDHRIRWKEGGGFIATRRERPWLLIENGKITWLFTGVYDGQHSWNQPVPAIPPWPANRRLIDSRENN